MNKRGISPLIATVLIIGFTIVLAVLVIVWLSGVFEGELDKSQCGIKGQDFCASLSGIGGLLDVTATQAGTDAAVDITAVWAGDIAEAPDLRISVMDNTGNVVTIVNIGPDTTDDANYNANGIATYQIPTFTGTAENAKVRALHTPDVSGVVCEEMMCTPITESVKQGEVVTPPPGVPPTIIHTAITETMEGTTDLTITAEITDDGTVSSATLYYGDRSGDPTSQIPMIPVVGEEDDWQTQTPIPSGEVSYEYGLQYYIYAEDDEENGARTEGTYQVNVMTEAQITPIIDKDVYWYTGNNYGITDDPLRLRFGFRLSGSLDFIYRSFIDFDTSGIPEENEINNIKLKIYSLEYHHLDQGLFIIRFSDDTKGNDYTSNQLLYEDIGNGDDYYVNNPPFYFQSTMDYPEIDLGGSAVNDIDTLHPSWFSVGLLAYDESTIEDNYGAIAPMGSAYPPTLIVNHYKLFS
ncbi:MAG: archaellin/type IV pilin N-terminal domain-containing protein [Candidatus Woesearchaeota archaeon]